MPTVLLCSPSYPGDVGEQALLGAFLAALAGHDTLIAVNGRYERHWCDRRDECETINLQDPRAAARGVRRADAVVVAGGVLFHTRDRSDRSDRGDHQLRSLAALLAGAVAQTKPVIMLGVAAGRLSTPFDRWLARQMVQKADLLILSDEESALLLAEAGTATPLRIGADPAWVGLGAPLASNGRGDLVVVAFEEGRGAGHRHLVIDALGHLSASGLPIRLVPWTASDVPGARSLGAGLKSAVQVVDPPTDLMEARDYFCEAAVVLALTYRALHAAAVAGVPVVVLADEARTAGLARRLQQPFLSSDSTPSHLAEVVVDTMSRVGASPAMVKEEVARAEAGFDLLRLVLSGGVGNEAVEMDSLTFGPEPCRR